MKSCIQHISEVKSAVAERFIRILKSKIFQIYEFNIKNYVYREINWYS